MEYQSHLSLFKNFENFIDNDLSFSENTRLNYCRITAYYLNFLESFGIENFSDVGQDILMKFIKYRRDKKYARAYVNLRMSALNLFYTWAYRNRFCNKHLMVDFKKSELNKAVDVDKKPRSNHTKIEILCKEEQGRLLSMVTSDEFAAVRDRCIVELILASAMSAGEIISISQSALNLESKCISIIKATRKRKVNFDATICLASLKKWLQIRQEALSNRSNYQSLFFTKNYEQITKRQLYHIVSNYLLKAGIQKVHLGSDVLRQTAICSMFKQQKTLDEVRDITGIQTLERLEKYRAIAEKL